jgi:hypothetical protein
LYALRVLLVKVASTLSVDNGVTGCARGAVLIQDDRSPLTQKIVQEWSNPF